MSFYYLFFLIVLLPIVIILIRSFILRKKKIPVALFAEALRNENKGDYESAIVAYENALQEAKKTRFYNSSMKNKIIEKLKVLHTVIDYNNNSQLQQVQ